MSIIEIRGKENKIKTWSDELFVFSLYSNMESHGPKGHAQNITMYGHVGTAHVQYTSLSRTIVNRPKFIYSFFSFSFLFTFYSFSDSRHLFIFFQEKVDSDLHVRSRKNTQPFCTGMSLDIMHEKLQS